MNYRPARMKRDTFLEQQKQQKSSNRTDQTKTWKCSFLRLPNTIGKINTTHERRINITNKSKLDLFQWLYLVHPKYLNNWNITKSSNVAKYLNYYTLHIWLFLFSNFNFNINVSNHIIFAPQNPRVLEGLDEWCLIDHFPIKLSLSCKLILTASLWLKISSLRKRKLPGIF